MAEKIQKVESKKNTQNKIRDLEQFYTTNQVENLPKLLDLKKKKMTQELMAYAEEHKKPIKWNEDGDPIEYDLETNPLVIYNTFFKSIMFHVKHY